MDVAKIPEVVDPDAKKPVVVSFTLIEKAGMYYAIAIQSRGRKVLQEFPLDSDDSKRVIVDTLDRESRKYYLHGISPFDPKET